MTLELVPVETSPMAEDGNGDAAKGAHGRIRKGHGH